MLTIVGGTYIENCMEPEYSELFGSGLRAATALSGKGFPITYRTCICDSLREELNLKSKTFSFNTQTTLINSPISFSYYHPLSPPFLSVGNNNIDLPVSMDFFEVDNVLYYGLVEANAKFKSKFVVYDPQNHRPFSSTGSTTENLALVLNRKEAKMISGADESTALLEMGKQILLSEDAKVVIIKNGAKGALVIEATQHHLIPVFQTTKVWPIGSGDIFSAVFAWKWMIEKKSARESALLASKFTAKFCQTQQIPLSDELLPDKELVVENQVKKIYLAGPFFTMEQRWLINEARSILLEFGNDVFSPFHDVGIGHFEDSRKIALLDLEALKRSDVVFAIGSGLDAGTLYEIGFARSLNKRVVIFVENVKNEDLTMLAGTDCEIVHDFSTAIYKVSW